jgi:glycosyltransferase involved in cell wall biosynthesis
MTGEKRANRPSILSLGVIREGASYGRHFRSVYALLASYFDIHHIGTDYFAGPCHGEWSLHPNLDYRDITGSETLKQLMEALNPDIVLLINDLWKVPRPLAALDECKRSARVVVSCPIDGAICDGALVAFLPGVDRFIVYNEFSKATVINAIETQFQENMASLAGKVVAIPNGVDTVKFFPLTGMSSEDAVSRNRIIARNKLFPDRPELEDAFIVLNANMNQPRKRLDVALEGFAQFVRDKPPSVKLLLHCKWDESGSDLVDLGRRLEISDRLLAAGDVNTLPSLDDMTLNFVYNACEVGLNTSMGEGWGFISFEHAATGAAQVLTGHACALELWSGAAELINPVATISSKESFLEMQCISPEQVATTLNRLYHDPQQLAAISLACYERASRPMYSWSAVADQWHDLLLSTLQ